LVIFGLLWLGCFCRLLGLKCPVCSPIFEGVGKFLSSPHSLYLPLLIGPSGVSNSLQINDHFWLECHPSTLISISRGAQLAMTSPSTRRSSNSLKVLAEVARPNPSKITLVTTLIISPPLLSMGLTRDIYSLQE